MSVALVGCSTTIAGSALRQRPSSLQRALPTVEQVRVAVGNPLDPIGQPVLGSINVLPDGIRGDDAVDPIECLGAITPLMRWVYEKGDVRDVAWQDFARFGEGQTVSSANTGVVRFDSDAEASRMFTQFVTRWRSCEGGRVGINAGGDDVGLSVTDVTLDVDVAVTAPDPARRVATTRAVDLVRAMLGNLSGSR